MIPHVMTNRDELDRPSRESLHMQTAWLWSMRSLDPRLRVGAVITSEDMTRVLSFGYNGPAKGLPPEFIRSEPGNSGCLHAEENALLKLSRHEPGMKMFVTHLPCEMCAQRMVQVGVTDVYYCEDYRCRKGFDVLAMCKVRVHKIHRGGELKVELVTDFTVIPGSSGFNGTVHNLGLDYEEKSLPLTLKRPGSTLTLGITSFAGGTLPTKTNMATCEPTKKDSSG